MFKAYINGRSEKDPSEFWYRGELGFFDFYIIPLAKKLKDCGVFGVASDEVSWLGLAVGQQTTCFVKKLRPHTSYRLAAPSVPQLCGAKPEGMGSQGSGHC